VLPVLFNPVSMNFPAFRLSLLTLALTCAWGAQAATARTDIARPTDFAAQSVSQGPMVCQSSKVKTCGRRVAGKLGMPAGSAPKSAYRFVEEEFLFDSGVAIFLETAVPENRNAHAGWRRRLAFKKTAEGFQLVQVGIQYRCQGGSWQKEACGPASQLARRKADGKVAAQAQTQAQAGNSAGRTQPGAASAGTQAGAAVAAAQAASGAGQDASNRVVTGRASAGQPGQDASRTANTQDPAVRVLRSDRPDAGVRSATPVETITPTEQEAVPALDARWRPRQDAIEQDEAVTAAHPDQKQRAAEAESQRHAAEQAEAARKAGTSDRAADLDALRRDEAIANQGLSEEDALVAARERRKGAAGQGGASGHGERNGTPSAHSAADIVAANPSISADQLKQMHAAEASLARATAGSAPGVVDAGAASSDQEGADRAQTGPAMIDNRTDARGAADQDPAGNGSGQRTGKDGQPAAQAGSAQGGSKASSDPDARRGWQTAVIEAAGSNHGTRVPATLPATVRTADGFAPMALSTENAAQLGKPCEQPIEMCGKQVFETLFPVQASTLAALPVNQSRRESFIYADGPVTSAVYLVTMANLPDDSIASQRIRIEFVRRGAGWVAVSAGRQFKCREGEQVRQQWTDRSCR
jgi:hypothetical protein